MTADSSLTMNKRLVEYWEKSLPWSFRGETISYKEKRLFRYTLQDYMLGAIGFESFRSKVVLELGSGGGLDSAEFGRNGAEIVSVDFTESAVKITRDLLKEAGVAPNVIRATAQKLPLRDSAVDCVYTYGVLHHIPNVENVIQEISRILKAKGQLICMLYHKKSLLYAYSILFLHRDEGLAEDELLRLYSERSFNSPYTKAYTKEEAQELFSKYFDSIQTKVYYTVIDLPGKRKLKLSISDEFELGWHIIIKALRNPQPV